MMMAKPRVGIQVGYADGHGVVHLAEDVLHTICGKPIGTQWRTVIISLPVVGSPIPNPYCAHCREWLEDTIGEPVPMRKLKGAWLGKRES